MRDFLGKTTRSMRTCKDLIAGYCYGRSIDFSIEDSSKFSVLTTKTAYWGAVYWGEEDRPVERIGWKYNHKWHSFNVIHPKQVRGDLKSMFMKDCDSEQYVSRLTSLINSALKSKMSILDIEDFYQRNSDKFSTHGFSN